MRTLKERLADWTDFDGASYELGVVLGLFPEFDTVAGTVPDGWGGLKHVVWTANPLGDGLYNALQALVTAGVLELNDDDQFRWNPNCRSYLQPKASPKESDDKALTEAVNTAEERYLRGDMDERAAQGYKDVANWLKELQERRRS